MSTTPHVAVILAGSGRFDGSEITEAVSTLLALDQRGATYQCLALNKPQRLVFDHLTNTEASTEPRNQMVEAARIARGDIKDIASANPSDFDAVIVPGGDGSAKNLHTFAIDGPACTVDPDVQAFLTSAANAKTPIGFICISPALCAAVFGKTRAPNVTIGSNPDVAAAIEQTGAKHTACAATDIVTDEHNRFVTTPAYMEAKGPAEVYEGIAKLVDKVLELAKSPVPA